MFAVKLLPDVETVTVEFAAVNDTPVIPEIEFVVAAVI